MAVEGGSIMTVEGGKYYYCRGGKRLHSVHKYHGVADRDMDYCAQG